MIPKPVLCLARCFLPWMGAAAPLAAQIPAGDCLIGPQTAASLLFPYFEVDKDNPGGMTTLIAISNADSTPTLARVVLWTDWGNPVLAFDLYLGAFDIAPINLRDVMNGVLPATSVTTSGYPYCASPPFPLSPAELSRMQAALSGQPDPTFGDCWGETYADRRMRGYITVDASRECGGVQPLPLVRFAPDDAVYPISATASPTASPPSATCFMATSSTSIPPQNLADGSEAVALWADPTRFPGPNVFTFYGRFHGWDGRDRRVPLPSAWNLRFLNGGPFAGGAAAIVYHDPGTPYVGNAACGFRPGRLPLAGTAATLDEDGQNFHGVSNLPLRLVSSKTSLDQLSPAYPAGLLQLNGATSQMWVQSVLSARNRFSLGFNATPIDYVCNHSPF